MGGWFLVSCYTTGIGIKKPALRRVENYKELFLMHFQDELLNLILISVGN
jgi:hypothetical protein